MRKLRIFGQDIIIGKNVESEVKEQLYGQVYEEVEKVIEEERVSNQPVYETLEVQDNSNSVFGSVEKITEQVVTSSPSDVRKMLDSSNYDMRSILEALRQDYSDEEIYKENEEMAKDPVVGSAMEMMADDCSMLNAPYNKIVYIRSEDKKLQEFLNTFLDKNIEIEKRYWEWAFEVIKHGDFKLKRLEYSDGKVKSVYYENVIEGYKVHRIEYLGRVLGYLDTTEDNKVLSKPNEFIHFINTKLPKRKKLKVSITTESERGEKKKSEVTCYKVRGSSFVDNARYIYRVVNLLDDMLVMSRIARSSQYNLVKIEVGQAGPLQTQQIINDVRRRIEGSTRMSKKGVKTDPSPIPVNSNVYLPTREGKGDVIVESVNDSVDVKSIVDIDYFKNKEFATLKTPKAFMGFEDELPGPGVNASLTKLDIRYSRSIQRALNIVTLGIKDLCNNYLEFRGRDDDKDKFEVLTRAVTSVEDSNMVEDLMQRVAIFNDVNALLEVYEDFLDKGKLLHYVLNLVGIDPVAVGTAKMEELSKAIDKSKKIPETKVGNSEDTGNDFEEDTGDEGMGEEDNEVQDGVDQGSFGQIRG